MSCRLTRRGLLAGTLATAVTSPRRLAAAGTPRASDVQVRVISHLTHRYHGWPTVARRHDGSLLLAYSGGREGHICPFGRVELMRSLDEGDSWTWPEVVMDSPIDDRDAGVLETARGSLLVTSFTSLAYEPMYTRAEKGDLPWSDEKLSRWRAAHRRVDDAARQQALGVWMTRSTNGGLSWSERFDCRVNSPHGPIQLSDGRLLYAGKDLWRNGQRVGVCQSVDDGQTWTWLAQLTPRNGDDPHDYHELHCVESAAGRLILQLRNHNQRNRGETLQSESQDGGQTWSVPHSIGVWGLPSHLLRLRDGRLLMTYGHRRDPLGNQARVSDDEGRNWSEPILLSRDGSSSDLGYPTTVELTDGRPLTVWYERLATSPRAVLRQARWQLHR